MEEALKALGQQVVSHLPLRRSVTMVVHQFQTVAKDLSLVSQRLQAEFSSSASVPSVRRGIAASDLVVIQGPNPAGLLKRLRSINNTLPEIRTECDAIFAEKQALVDAAKQTLIPSRRSMVGILQALDSTDSEDNTSSSQSVLMDRATLDRKMFEMAAEMPPSAAKDLSLSNKENKSVPKSSQAKSKGTSAKKSHNSGPAVTSDEFDKLSSFVKGKCSLGAVNELLAILLKYFSTNPDKKCISTPQLISLGGKIKHAGDKKLGVLRTLKMIQITKSGIELEKKGLKTPRKVSRKAT